MTAGVMEFEDGYEVKMGKNDGGVKRYYLARDPALLRIMENMAEPFHWFKWSVL